MSFSAGRRYLGCAVETASFVVIYKAAESAFNSEEPNLITSRSWFKDIGGIERNEYWRGFGSFALTYSAYWALGPILSRAVTGIKHVNVHSKHLSSSILSHHIKRPHIFVAGLIFFGMNVGFASYQKLMPPARFPVRDDFFNLQTTRWFVNPIFDTVLFHHSLFSRLLLYQSPFVALLFSSTAFTVTHLDRRDSRASLDGHTGITARLSDFIDSAVFQATYIFTGGGGLRLVFPVMLHMLYNLNITVNTVVRNVRVMFLECSSLWQYTAQGVAILPGRSDTSVKRVLETTRDGAKEDIRADREGVDALCARVLIAYSSDGCTLSSADIGDMFYAMGTVIAQQNRSPDPTFDMAKTLFSVLANDCAYAHAIQAVNKRSGGTEDMRVGVEDLRDIIVSLLAESGSSPHAVLNAGSSTAKTLLFWPDSDGNDIRHDQEEVRSSDEEQLVLDIVDNYHKGIVSAVKGQALAIDVQLSREALARTASDGTSRMATGLSSDMSQTLPTLPGDVYEGLSCLPDAFVEHARLNEEAEFSEERLRLLNTAASRRAAIGVLQPYGLTVRRYNRLIREMSKKYPSVEELVVKWEQYFNSNDFTTDVLKAVESKSIGDNESARKNAGFMF